MQPSFQIELGAIKAQGGSRFPPATSFQQSVNQLEQPGFQSLKLLKRRPDPGVPSNLQKPPETLGATMMMTLKAELILRWFEAVPGGIGESQDKGKKAPEGPVFCFL